MDKNAGVFIINAMRAIAGKEWRAERESMLTIYQALRSSIIDHECMIYSIRNIIKESR